MYLFEKLEKLAAEFDNFCEVLETRCHCTLVSWKSGCRLSVAEIADDIILKKISFQQTKEGSVIENFRIWAAKAQDTASPKERPLSKNDVGTNHIAANNNSTPATKAQVVGWPPIRSCKKNSVATSSNNNEKMDGKVVHGALYIKVSMDGALYLRKVDLCNYSA
ncbi:auxin-responsive protein IAA9-like [Euphorbia lathyris]|uniref:auxin-responsive protein IAA9-like n=1 Tax=Euphorbia lathyris TaxID=212925 RepID=UPI003313221F